MWWLHQSGAAGVGHAGTALPTPRPGPPQSHISVPSEPLAERAKAPRLGVVRAAKFPVFSEQYLLFFAHWARCPDWPGHPPIILTPPPGSLFSVQCSF